jgi:hypothetical protein
MVEPTGVPANMENTIPINAQATEATAEKIVTALKLLSTLIAERAGKITSAEISSEPTKFMASTIITAVIVAISKLYNPTLVPTAFAKSSSKVTANILLYKRINVTTTMIESIPQTKTSLFVKVKIDAEPNNVEHTSPDTFPETGKRFISMYPKAKAPTEIIAIAASPFTFELLPFFKIRIAVSTVIGRISIILFVKLSTVAMARAPKATCDNPSPMYENLFNTRVTPSSDEHRAINIPTINA